jgi:hypothetical protein
VPGLDPADDGLAVSKLGNQVRAQPLVGATAGLIVLLLMESGTLDIGTDDSGHWAGGAPRLYGWILGAVPRARSARGVIPDKSALEAA